MIIKNFKRSALAIFIIALSTVNIANACITQSEKSTVKNMISDSAITASIKSDFLADSAINGLGIHVETTNGIVTLTGTVPSGDMKARAESIAQSTNGVKEVVSKLRIK